MACGRDQHLIARCEKERTTVAIEMSFHPIGDFGLMFANELPDFIDLGSPFRHELRIVWIGMSRQPQKEKERLH